MVTQVVNLLHAGDRPWFQLYNQYVRLGNNKNESDDEKAEDAPELALIQQLLPEELLLLVLERLPSYSLAMAQCCCKQFRRLGQTQRLWERACRGVFPGSTPERNRQLLRSKYSNCWRTMYLERPHLRFDGVYVSRNTYIRTGVVEWETRNAVHLVLYFRYLRFFADGTFLYRTSPDPPSRACKALVAARGGTALHGGARGSAHAAAGGAGGGVPGGGAPPPTASARTAANKQGSADVNVFCGQWRLAGDRLYTALRYQNQSSTEVRSRLVLRSSTRGANNRLDIVDIVSFDRTDGSAVPMMAAPQGPDGDPAPGANMDRRSYSRGTTTYVLVPLEALPTTVLNKPITELDFYLPG